MFVVTNAEKWEAFKTRRGISSVLNTQMNVEYTEILNCIYAFYFTQ